MQLRKNKITKEATHIHALVKKKIDTPHGATAQDRLRIRISQSLSNIRNGLG